MKEPNLGTPVEDDIRTHFGNLLSPQTDIEIIPHTKVWATVDGVLLWDPKNGYADLYDETGDYNPPVFDNTVRFNPYTGRGREPAYIATTNDTHIASRLKTVVYITGPQGTGKTSLVNLMIDAVELNRRSFIGFTDLSRAITKHNQYQTVAITTNDLRPQAFNVDNALRIWCRERKLEYLNINLTTDKHGHL